MGGVTALVLNAVLPEDGDSGTPSVMGDPIAEDDD
jgi:hypothetical protein